MNKPLVLDRSSNPHATFCVEPSLTKQSFKDECDVNQVVERFARTGNLGDLNPKVPIFADVSQVPDLRSALSIVETATDLFSALDAKVRVRFNNDPAVFYEFISDQKNLKEASDLGLLAKPLDPVVDPKAQAPAPPAGA